jgi:hypothetical protein
MMGKLVGVREPGAGRARDVGVDADRDQRARAIEHARRTARQLRRALTPPHRGRD